MITYKHITKIIGVVMAAAVAVFFLAMMFSEDWLETFGGNAVSMRYESELFAGDEVMRIDVQMEEKDWEDMLANAVSEEYYSCNIEINGEKIYHVGIRPKGNTSLSAIAMDPETDRFSLKLEFDHYVEGQTCFGLDKLILNNNYADATNMKEAIVYDMYRYLDTDASLYHYAEVSVNGEYWGVYLALEAIEDSFLLRNYGTEDGGLYKPETMDMGGGPSGRRDMPEPPGDMSELPENMPEPPGDMSELPEDMSGLPGNMPEPATDGKEELAREEEIPMRPPQYLTDDGEKERFPMGGGKRGPSMENGGADLNYTDDELDSYSAIWEGSKTNTGKQDYRKVVTALKNISGGTELEEYLDVDNVLKYMAVHTFSVNMDSLSGNMAHNYYLYEYDGKLNILPWDYNLAFGGMGVQNASEMINKAVDTPFQGTEFFDMLLENEEYLSIYHEYLRRLAEEYVLGGKFEETFRRIRNQIDALVEADPTAFYSYEEYDTAADMLYLAVMLRAESIKGQLDGTIPSTEEGQRADSSCMVDASDVDLERMGTFDMGRKFGESRGERK